MDLNQLKYFEVIARYENLSRAQEVLHVAQPALSAGLARLENQLGVKLFERKKGRLELNAYGEILLKYVTNINADFDRALKEIEQKKQQLSNSVSIGIMDLGFSLSVISDFLQVNPNIRVYPDFVQYTPNLQNIPDGLDLLIAPRPADITGMEYIPLDKKQLYLAAPPGHHFYDRSSIRLEELEGEALYCGVGVNSHLSYFIMELLSGAGITPSSLNYCLPQDMPQVMTTYNAISLFFLDVLVRVGDYMNIHFLAFDPPIYRHSGILYSADRPRSQAAKCFCDYVTGSWTSPEGLKAFPKLRKENIPE